MQLGHAMQESEREVSREEGQAFARQHGCLFVLKILDTPNLLDQAPGAKLQAAKEKPYQSACC